MKPATLLKLILLRGCFSRFLNCTNNTKSSNAPHISYFSLYRFTKPCSVGYLLMWIDRSYKRQVLSTPLEYLIKYPLMLILIPYKDARRTSGGTSSGFKLRTTVECPMTIFFSTIFRATKSCHKCFVSTIRGGQVLTSSPRYMGTF